MNHKQADNFISTKVMRYIGAVRTYAARVNFFLGIPNTLMIGVLFYNDSPLIKSIFPSVYIWLGFIIFVIIPFAIGVDRFILHPAQITYNAHQTSIENRNPTYREIMEIKRILEERNDE